MDDEEQGQTTEDQPSNFLVLASQSETQYSEWDQQHLLQSLPALRSQTMERGKEKYPGNIFPTKSDDERPNVQAPLLVADTGSEVSRHEDTDVPDRIEDSFSEEEEETDGVADITVVKRLGANNNNEDLTYSPVIKSQDHKSSAVDHSDRDRSARNLFPATLSQQDQGPDLQGDHIVSTPSEHLGSLHLSGQVTVPETVEESLDVLAPSPGAYGDVPLIIPSSPTASEGEAETSGFNPDANRTLEDESVLRSLRRQDRRERLPPSEAVPNPSGPITIDDTVPENEDDEMLILDLNEKTLACEETQPDSLHLVYSATEAGERTEEEGQIGNNSDNSVEDPDKDTIEDSQDLALHLSQSQGEAIVTAATIKGKSSSQPEPSSSGKGASRLKSRSTSTDSDGTLIQSKKTADAEGKINLEGEKVVPPALASVPSLSISRFESQSQGSSDPAFRIEKPELQMTEEREEGGQEMNVFKRTRVGQSKPARKNISIIEDSSEDFFNIKRTKSKASQKETQGKPKGATEEAVDKDREGEEEEEDKGEEEEVDSDAETQEDKNQREKQHGVTSGVKPGVTPEVTPEKPTETANPFDESTETYDVSKSSEIEIIEGLASKGSVPTVITISSSSLADPSKSQSLNPSLKNTKSHEASMEVEETPEVIPTKDTADQQRSQSVKNIPESGKHMARVEQENISKSPSGGKKISEPIDVDSRTSKEELAATPSHLTDPEPSTSKGKKQSQAESRCKGKAIKSPTTSGRSRDGVAYTSRSTRAQAPPAEMKGRTASVTKDSGIGEQLDDTSEVSPKKGAKPAALEKQISDPYTFHGTQSQPLDQAPLKTPQPTTPLSSRKKQKGAIKRVSSKKDPGNATSSSSDMKAPSSKPRPKKLRFTKVQKKTTIRSTEEPTEAGSKEGVKASALPRQDTVVLDAACEADISRSPSTQGTAQRHVAFQEAAEKTPSVPATESGRLSDSQTSDQLSEVVTVTITKKLVEIKTTVRKVLDKEGKVIKHYKQEEFEETMLPQVFFSEEKRDLPLVSPSRTASSLTPGDLADISSGFSRSNSTNSTKSSLEKVSSIDLVSPTAHRHDDSFVTLLTASTTRLPHARGITTNILSPQVSAQERQQSIGERRISDIHVDAHTPDVSVIEKADSRIGGIVTSSGGPQVSDSLFSSPEAKKGKSASPKQSSPALRKRAADSSQDSSSDNIQSAQRPRISESGGFSVHGSAYSQQRPRVEAPLHLLVTSDSDIPPSQNRRQPSAEKEKPKEKSSSEHLSPEIPLQTTSNAGSDPDIQCQVVHASTAAIGSSVMAKWKDGFFYPGKIVKLDQNGRFYIRFDDGDQMYVKIQNILLVQSIPIGQSVMVMSQDGYFDCGMVVGYEQEEGNLLYKVSKDEGDMQRFSRSQIILSEDQASCLISDEDMRVPAAITAGTTSTKLGDVSLDNLVVGERRRRHKTDEDKPAEKKKEEDKTPNKTSDTSKPSRKGKTVHPDPQPHKVTLKQPESSRSARKDRQTRSEERKEVESPQKADIRSLRKGRQPREENEAEESPKKSADVRSLRKGRQPREEMEGEESPKKSKLTRSAGKGRFTRGEEKEDESPAVSSERSLRKGRSARDLKEEAEGSVSRGKKRKQPEGSMMTSTPTPKSKRPADSTVAAVTPSTSGIGGAVDSPSTSRRNTRRTRVGLFESEKSVERPSNLLQGMVFLLTHVEKSAEQRRQEKKLLQDSSLETSTEESGIDEEPSVPFDKESLRANIETQGGVVLDKFDQTQIDSARKAFLVSSTFQRTVKYFECLAAGVPCVSHQWIIHSCSQGKLLDHKAYMLPAGISLERRKLMEWNPCGSCLAGMTVMVVSTNIKFQDAWRSILTISRCTLVNRLALRNQSEEQVDFVVSDINCPASILHQARRSSVPVVSTEWVIQCLINGHMVGYDAHPQYRHDFQEK